MGHIIFKPVYTDRIHLLSSYGSTIAKGFTYGCGHADTHAYVIRVPERLTERLRAQGMISTVKETLVDVVAVHHSKSEGFDKIGVIRDTFCSDCLIKHHMERTLRCCMCGEEIVAGSQIVLHRSYLPRLEAITSSFMYKKDAKRYVGCTEGYCAHETSARSTWTGKAFDPPITPGHFVVARRTAGVRTRRSRRGSRSSDSPPTG